jgi:hypothetical protein
MRGAMLATQCSQGTLSLDHFLFLFPSLKLAPPPCIPPGRLNGPLALSKTSISRLLFVEMSLSESIDRDSRMPPVLVYHRLLLVPLPSVRMCA